MFTLDQVVPWGRTFDEYRRMFALGPVDLRRRILGCGDGPASFNAEATRRGSTVLSCDPIYRFGEREIRNRVESTCDVVLDETRRNAAALIWTVIRSIDELRTARLAAMNEFLADFEIGKTEGRYVDAELPELPWPDNSFDLALCSHLLFLYSAQFDSEFHARSIRELCRVAHEVRIFPLLALGGERSWHLDAVTGGLEDFGYGVSIETVPYEFQRGGNEMMVVRRAS